MNNANHQRAEGIQYLERNPYAVLNLCPVDRENVRRELNRALMCLSVDQFPVITPEEQDDAHPFVKQIQRDLTALEGKKGVAVAEQRQTLTVLLQQVRVHVATRRILAAETPSEEAFESLRPLFTLIKNETILAENEVITSEHVARLRVALGQEECRLKQSLARPNSSSRYRAIVQAIATIAQMDGSSLSVDLGRQIDHLWNQSHVIELARTLAYRDSGVNEAYRSVAAANHADVRPGDAVALERFKEATIAHQRLIEASDEQRLAFARNLVFGQRTELWTSDMRAAAKPIVDQFAALFAMEQPIGLEAVPCDDCKGNGAIVVQGPTDYFPVPVVCDCCNGEGKISAASAALRKALESLSDDEDDR